MSIQGESMQNGHFATTDGLMQMQMIQRVALSSATIRRRVTYCLSPTCVKFKTGKRTLTLYQKIAIVAKGSTQTHELSDGRSDADPTRSCLAYILLGVYPKGGLWDNKHRCEKLGWTVGSATVVGITNFLRTRG